MKSIKTVLIVLLLLSAAVAYAGGKIVQLGLSDGTHRHVVSAKKITLSADKTTATVEIRDTDANPSGTSTVTVTIATGEITSHTGTTTADYTGWRVVKTWEIESQSAEPIEPQVIQPLGH